MRCVWEEPSRAFLYVVGEDEDGLDLYETPQEFLLHVSERGVFSRLAYSNQIPLPITLQDDARLEAPPSEAGKRIDEEELARFHKALTNPDNGAGFRFGLGPRQLDHVRHALPFVSGADVGGGLPLEERDYLTRLVALFLDYRTRGLSAWGRSMKHSRGDIADLARHLFCQYPVPAWLDAVWGASESVKIREIERSLKWACWFVCLGNGGSLRKLARLMGFRLRNGTVAHLLDAPAHLMPELACMWAEAVAITGKKRVADWLVKHPGYGIDPTVVPRGRESVQFSRFWLQTVQWFAQYEDQLTDEQADELLEWGWYKFDQSRNAGGTPFGWSGRTPRRCLREAPAFLERALRALGGETNRCWEAVGVSWELSETDTKGGEEVWRFEELVQSSALWEEGVAMRHCVARYDGACHRGMTVIVSLRRNGMRALTIELQGEKLVLGQVKGRFNRKATAEEERVVRRWVEEVVRCCARKLRQ